MTRVWLCVLISVASQDLPTDVKKKVLSTGIAESKLDMHFDVLCTVLHFKLCVNVFFWL